MNGPRYNINRNKYKKSSLPEYPLLADVPKKSLKKFDKIKTKKFYKSYLNPEVLGWPILWT